MHINIHIIMFKITLLDYHWVEVLDVVEMALYPFAGQLGRPADFQSLYEFVLGPRLHMLQMCKRQDTVRQLYLYLSPLKY